MSGLSPLNVQQKQPNHTRTPNLYTIATTQPRSPRAVTAAMAAEEALRKERAARSLAIERAYVHDVYEQESDNNPLQRNILAN